MNLDYRHLTDTYYRTRRNKRRGRDAVEYEVLWMRNVVRDTKKLNDRTFRVERNYAFLTSRPKWREIFATSFEGRMADHELCDTLMPYVERELSPRTYNNRKGMGSQAAINQVIEDMCTVTDGYIREGWVIKVDYQAFFPSARWDIMEQCLRQVIDKYEAELDAEHGDGCAQFLRWLTMILIHCNPAAHCELRTPRRLWREHIPQEKSLFGREEGVGAPIGRLTSQTCMALYVNGIVRWLTEDCGLLAVQFVDDCVIQVHDGRKAYALSLLPELRRRLEAVGLRLNERKFYCQPARHGLEFLGTHIKPHRLILNDATWHRCMEAVKESTAPVGYADTPRQPQQRASLLSRVNSYAGLLKSRTSYRRLCQLREAVSHIPGLRWNQRRQCLEKE